MDKYEFRTLIKHYFIKGKTATETKASLDKHYGESAPSFSTIKNWYSDFKRGRTCTKDEYRSGRPSEVTTEENTSLIEKIIMEDRKVKIRQIAEDLGISKDSVWRTIHEKLHMKKVIAKWVPRSLTIDQKNQRVNDSKINLALFQRNPNDFLRRYITCDETWIHFYTPESTQQSKQWISPGESAPKRPKTQKTAGKIMATFFWDAKGILLIDYLEKGKTITGPYYAALLDRLKDEITRSRPHLAKNKVLFHHDNAPCHTSFVVQAKLDELGFQMISQPPYSPDLAPSDFFLFPNFKRFLSGKRFNSNEEVKQETEQYFGGYPSTYFLEGIEKIENRWYRCIDLQGSYVE